MKILKKLRNPSFSFILASLVLFSSCKDNELLPLENESKSFEFYFENTSKLNDFVFDLAKSYPKKELNSEDLEEFIYENIKKSELNSINYIDIGFYKRIKDYRLNQKSNEEITLQDTGLSQKSLDYFYELENLNEAADYFGMVTLLEQYKLEYNSDPSLESLAGVFAVIEYYKDDLSTNNRPDCELDGSAAAGAAIGGAIMGGRVGFIFGSWLGPAG